METVPQVQEAWVLTVDGVAAGACAAREEVEEALALVKEGYSNESTTSVTDIITAVGYTNRTQFYRDFETFYGTTPAAYREEK
jgi:methylphosphotriester-DNA--protein-cysteine methyltransferase